MPDTPDIIDIFVIGGGVNGCGIARDAAGRGLSVTLAEMGDLASATSSASTKLFHGGLRYLEYYEFGLVRKALKEREVLLSAMPHISWPMRFVLPHQKGMRPAWLLRLGLFIYDHLGGRKILPATRTLDLRVDIAGEALKDTLVKAFEYSDCWVQDSRLVVLNARDAAEHGARILTRTKVIAAKRHAAHWDITVQHGTGAKELIKARKLVNAAGPWVEDIVRNTIGLPSDEGVRLVRGSHIVVPKIFDHDRAYFFQGGDRRIIFAIPYEGDFTLIGTTEQEHTDDIGAAMCTKVEVDYLCTLASEYYKTPVKASDVIWTYSGVRPLYDDGAKSATEATRDYVLSLNDQGAPLLSIFGGKITTYRRLAEATLEKLGHKGGAWTAGAPLPGGNFPVDGVADLIANLRADYPFLNARWAQRLIRTYGTEARDMLGDARDKKGLGQDFGAGLFAREVNWLMAQEFAQTPKDILWRRTRLGLHVAAQDVTALGEYMKARS
ncbi:MAG: glycerol-3-phosphate dehydrogenase [Paracoccaceae bacterium]